MESSKTLKCTAGLLALLLSAIPAAVGDQEPFSVLASLTTSSAEQTVLTVAFSISGNHYLYADKIRIQAAQGVKLVPKSIPEGQRKHDKFTGSTVRIFENNPTFIYAVEQVDKTPVKVEVSYQGCSDRMCFLPVTKTFLFLQNSFMTASLIMGLEKCFLTHGCRFPPQNVHVKNFSLTALISG